MNLALSALLILLLLLPAFSFRLGISITSALRRNTPRTDDDLRHQVTSRNVSKALAKLNFTETIFLFSIVPIILHLTSMAIIGVWATLPFDLLLNIFSGKEDVINAKGDAKFQLQLNWFLLYTLVEVIIATLFGMLMASLLIGRTWMMEALMGNNIWYKLFTGYTLPQKDRKKIHSILIEVLMLTKETTVIYSGFLQSFEVVQGTDQLSYITLQSASRRDLRALQQSITKPLAHGSETHLSFDKDYGVMINIPGHNFTIQGKDILNVNITYMQVVEDPKTRMKSLIKIEN